MSVSTTVAAVALAMMLGTGPLMAAVRSGPVQDRPNEQAMAIAADICVYTNQQLVVESLPAPA